MSSWDESGYELSDPKHSLNAGASEGLRESLRTRRAQFNWTRDQVGIAIDGVAALVCYENRNGPEAKLLHQLQDAYRDLRPQAADPVVYVCENPEADLVAGLGERTPSAPDGETEA